MRQHRQFKWGDKVWLYQRRNKMYEVIGLSNNALGDPMVVVRCPNGARREIHAHYVVLVPAVDLLGGIDA